MDIYTLTDNNEMATIYCTDAGEPAATAQLDIGTLAQASGDNTDRLQLVGVRWMIQQGDSVSLAWDTGGGTGAGTTFATFVGNSNGAERFPGSSLTADDIEIAGSTIAGAGDLYITATGVEFTLILFLKKIEGFSGFPEALGDVAPFGIHALD
jgi:hypothetical protein